MGKSGFPWLNSPDKLLVPENHDMLGFNDLLKGFKENFSAAMAAAMVLAIIALAGYIISLHSKLDRIGAERLQAQIDCSKQVLECEKYWQGQFEALERQELEKTQRHVDELNQILKQVKK